MPPGSSAPFLQINALSKRLPWGLALDQVSFSVAAGELVALVGPDVSDKSILLDILEGKEAPDAGSIEVNGDITEPQKFRQAAELGISIIRAEPKLLDKKNVSENIWLGHEWKKFGFPKRKEMLRRSNEILQELNVKFQGADLVRTLSAGQKLMVGIARAISQNVRLLVLEKVAASLSAQESVAFFHVVDFLKARGMAILYIPHQLSEVQRLADHVVGLRQGRLTGELPAHACDQRTLSKLAAADVLPFVKKRHRDEREWVVLDVRGLRTTSHPRYQVGFDLHRGEIVALVGETGAGRGDVLRALAGIQPGVKGDIIVNGELCRIRRPADALSNGIAWISFTPDSQPLVQDKTALWNISLPTRSRFALAKFGFHRRAIRKVSQDMAEIVKLDPQLIQKPVSSLSRGDQMKSALAKALSSQPMILLMDQPTKGIDADARHDIYRVMEQLASEGMAVLFLSNDVEEILTVSDRVVVMHKGELAGQLMRHEVTAEAIKSFSMGKRLFGF